MRGEQVFLVTAQALEERGKGGYETVKKQGVAEESVERGKTVAGQRLLLGAGQLLLLGAGRVQGSLWRPCDVGMFTAGLL